MRPHLTKFRMSGSRRGAWLLLATLTCAAQAQGFNFKLPADYSKRFGSTAAVYDAANSLYGVRYLPLPTPLDLRVIYVSRPAYNEYGLSARLKDATLLAGNFYGGGSGIRTLKFDYYPATGFQTTTLLEGSDIKKEHYLNYTQFGYAQRWKTVRLTSAMGYGFNGQASAAYLAWVLSDSRTFKAGAAVGLPGVKFTVAASSRLWLYPVMGEVYSSTNLSATLGGQITDKLTASMSHLERLAVGQDVLGFGYADYRESRLKAQYQINADLGPLSLRSAQFNAYRIWGSPTDLNNVEELSATLRADITPLLSLETTPAYDFYYGLPSLKAALLFKVSALPSAIGPSIKYVWKPSGSAWTGSVWQYGLAITAKE